MPKRMTSDNIKRLVVCLSNGNHIFLCYRHGNPKDVFQSTRMTTDPEIKECSDYDFRLESLGVDPNLPAWRLQEPIREENKAAADQFLEKLEQAIADGNITFPPNPRQIPSVGCFLPLLKSTPDRAFNKRSNPLI
jgi:hypothetical protein